MYNLLSALLIIAFAATGAGQGFVPNQLYHVGLLILMGYLFGIAAERIRLPASLGYIAAGIVAGPVTGLIDIQFIDNTTSLSAFLLMLLLAESASRMSHALNRQTIGFLVAGAVCAAIVFGIVMLSLSATSVSLAGRIGLSLFAAVSSPLLMDALFESGADERHHILAFGGLAIAVAAWGFAIAYLGPSDPQRLRLAFMPALIALTSTVFGYSLGLAGYALSGGKPLRIGSLYPAALLFLAFPFIGILGLDYLFIAAGFGVFSGITSTVSTAGRTPLLPITVFAVFGLSLGIDSMTIMEMADLQLTAILAASIIGGRVVVFWIVSRISGKAGGLPVPVSPLLTAGPVALLLAVRFLPGLPIPDDDSWGQSRLLDICTASIFIILIFTSIQKWMILLYQSLKNPHAAVKTSV